MISSISPRGQDLAARRYPRRQSGTTSQAGDSVELSKPDPEEVRSLETKLGPHRPGEVIVRLKGGLDDDFLQKYGARLLYRFDVPREIYQEFEGELLQLRLPPGMSVAEAMTAMGEDPQVEYAVPNHIYDLQGGAAPVFPDDLDERLWGLRNARVPGADIHAPEAWALSTGGGPVIAVLDTGADYSHPDLAGNIWTNPNEAADGQDNDGNGVADDLHGYNAHDDNGNPMDGHSHGTHVAGTIGACGNNGQGVVGVNWQARLMPVKIFNDGGRTTVDAIVRGILYATRMGARITSSSWGGGPFNQAIYDAFRGSPALHVMAAGNNAGDNDARPHYPSNFDLPNIVSVAASNRDDQLARFSNFGRTTVDLAAPGEEIFSTIPGGGYAIKSGTSMATPHVTGVAGLIASRFPEATNRQIQVRLLNSVDRLPQMQGKLASGGRLNAARALEDDTVAPGAPNDFRAAEARSDGVRLRWTASGDDGWCGEASQYELRFSDRPIVDGQASQDQISWEEASMVPVGLPGTAGTLEQADMAVMPSSTERQLHFAIKVADNVGNVSDMRSAAATIPAASLAFEDDADSGDAGWKAEAAWARVEAPGRGFVWTDSPGRRYDNQANQALTSPPISLAGFTGSRLYFDARYEIEDGYDRVRVEVSSNGQDWSQLSDFTGKSDWGLHSVDLSAYDGKDIQVRFRLETDRSVTADGFYLDRVVVAGAKNNAPELTPLQRR